GEKRLDTIIRDFWHRDIDVLVCTTIVETGLDISNANTLIVDQAHRFGLSQLHQLRGRVGRGRERAYAYFLYDPTKAITEQAHERLTTIAKNTALGSGFDVAMKDLELRGTGNLLGDAQSGHIEGVGFDLYIRMISQAVDEYKQTDKPVEPISVSIDIPVDASIPVDYISSDKLRLEVYRKLAQAHDDNAIEAIREEINDRYGKPNSQLEILFDLTKLRNRARSMGISELIMQGRNLRIGKVQLPQSLQMRISRIYKGSQYRPVTKTLLIPTPFEGSLGSGAMNGTQIIQWVDQVLEDLAWSSQSLTSDN
ncbi:MAG: helicase-related protein, partial [Bifidobacteriaceae bacterium]|nr:helicase-related protein [Bifidobacteriaceae bacterium]